jgi:Peptidase family M1 domain
MIYRYLENRKNMVDLGMKTFHFLFALTFLLTVNTGFTQSSLPVPLNIQQAINQGSRTASGTPGVRYWQNKGDYSIQVNFDPVTRLVSGTEQITYYNNSPDTLRQLLFKLYPNIYQKGAIREMPVKPQDLTDGVSLTNLTIAKLNQPVKTIPVGTNLQVPISILLPGNTLQISLGFSYTLNMGSHIRTGAIDSTAFFIAYFFPRIAVYDDIDGWNRYPYTGSQEFYNDFCHFAVSVTVPDNYMVWATGDLTNKEEVLGKKYINRISDAEKSDGITAIIDSSDLADKNITLHNPYNTWKFEAGNVTDFVFATSNHYLWNSSSVEVDPVSKRRTRVDAVFNPTHKDYKEVIDFARKTVDDMSYRFPKWPYPYPHETVFDGLDQMEYPMMVNDNPLDNRAEAIELTDHEIFHTMFPFYMGTNETKYGWMDEGWATIGEWLLSPMIDSSIEDDYGMEAYNRTAGKEVDLPITTLTTELTGAAFYLNSYPKPGLGYLFVKEMLGDSAFFKGLHYYISHWNGKHPAPLDFFYSMNMGSGKNLNWFWKRWFYDDGYPDLGFGPVKKTGNEYTVTVNCIGTKPVPVDLTIFFQDSTTQKIHKDISCWEKGERMIQLTFTSPKKVQKLKLGSLYVPDVNRKDNEYVW